MDASPPAPVGPVPAFVVPPGACVAIVLGDGTARLGMRLGDGLAVCAAPMPADLDQHDEAACEVWFTAEARLWVLATEADPCWVFARWWPGRGEPKGYDEDALPGLVVEAGEEIFGIAEAVCTVAAGVFPGWASYVPSIDPAVQVEAVWHRPGAVEPVA